MRGFWPILSMGLCLTGAGNAQDMVYSFAPTTDCLAAPEMEQEWDSCIGRAADACMQRTPGGNSTVGTSRCLSSEHEDWDRRLNSAYRVLSAQLKWDDDMTASLGSSAPKMAPALRDMQRAWISFRDASCAYEVSKWGGGTGGGPAYAGCLMYATARQTLVLESEIREYDPARCDHLGCRE